MKLSDAHLKQKLIEHLDQVRRFCFALTGNASDADDLAQSTVERLLQKGVPRDVFFAAWMHRVCKNLWIDQIRRTARISVPGAEMIERTLEPVDGESIAIDRLRMDEVANAMQQLDSDHRLVLALVTIEGYSYREAAEIMDVPIGTVMSRLSRARTRLLELM